MVERGSIMKKELDLREIIMVEDELDLERACQLIEANFGEIKIWNGSSMETLMMDFNGEFDGDEIGLYVDENEDNEIVINLFQVSDKLGRVLQGAFPSLEVYLEINPNRKLAETQFIDKYQDFNE
jgi:hypothetical protein